MLKIKPETIVNHILSRDECRSLEHTVFTAVPHPAYRKAAIQQAKQAAETPLPVLPLTEYLAFSREGNRSRYEEVYFARRNRLLRLLLGELADGKQGQFLDDIMDLLWAILEESTWVIPAHNLCFETNQSAPHEFGLVRHVDLFSATTAATISLAVWHLEEQIEEKMPRFFMERFHLEMNRRIFEPYCSDATGTFMNWKGIDGNYVNNWNPWIGLSCSTAALFGANDEELRKKVCQKALSYVNNWLKFIPENGVCLEGPNYFFPSNGSFFDLLELMRNATGGKADFRDDPAVRRMICSIAEYYVGNGRWASIYDCGSGKVSMDGAVWLNRAGRSLQSPELQRIAREGWEALGLPFMVTHTDTTHVAAGTDSHFPLRTMLTWQEGPFTFDETTPFQDGCHYNHANEQFFCRKGDFYVRLKGGHNHEPHGHNDVGEFMLYYKGQPVFIDPGHETYCADTFNENRYNQWYIRSDWHNTPVINGQVQHGGPQLLNIPRVKTAKNVSANVEDGWAQMELQAAYPPESDLFYLWRKLQVNEGDITVTDTVSLNGMGTYAFHLVSLEKPIVESNRLIYPLADRQLVCEITPGMSIQVEEQGLTDQLIRSAWDRSVIYRTKITCAMEQGSFELKIVL